MVTTLRVLATASVLSLFGGAVPSVEAQTPITGGARFFLSGVVVVEGRDAKAWLQEPTLTKGGPIVMRVGDRIGPWTLTAISPNRVELEGPGGKFAVPLNGVGGPGVGSQVAATAPTVKPPVTGPAVTGDGNVNIGLGDPRRRESIEQLFGTPQERESAGFATRPPSPFRAITGRRARDKAANRASAQPSSDVVIPAGDPRRQDAIRQLFGTR